MVMRERRTKKVFTRTRFPKNTKIKNMIDVESNEGDVVRKRKVPDPNRPRRWDAVIKRIPTDRQVLGAEIGVWVGDTAWRVLAQRPNAFHYLIDPWREPDPDSRYAKSPDGIALKKQHYFDKCMEKTINAISPYEDRAEIYRMTSGEAAGLITNRSLDYVFIDAEHTYEGVKEDIYLWLPKVAQGGWIGGHDYGNLPRFPGVQKAVDEFFPEGLEIDGDCTWFWKVEI